MDLKTFARVVLEIELSEYQVEMLEARDLEGNPKADARWATREAALRSAMSGQRVLLVCPTRKALVVEEVAYRALLARDGQPSAEES